MHDTEDTLYKNFAVETSQDKPRRFKRNNVVRPGYGTKTRRVWDISDEITYAGGSPALFKDVLRQAAEEGLNKATAATHYRRWCTFHGHKLKASANW